MNDSTFAIPFQTLGLGRYLNNVENQHVVDYVFQKIVEPKGGNRLNAEYIIATSHVLLYKNQTPVQPDILKITWYGNFDPWKFYELSEYFLFRKSSLQLISLPVCQEIFWLPEADGQNATRASIALRRAVSIEPVLAELFEFRTRELSRYGVIIPSEEKKFWKAMKKKYHTTLIN